MSLSDLASIGSFVNGLAVVISLIFVGFQLLQNTKAVRASASQAHSANYQQITASIVQHGDFAHIWRRGVADLESLSEDERVRFVSFSSSVFRFFEATRLQWLHGQLDDGHWQNVERQAVDFTVPPGIKAFWTMRRHWHSQDFQEWFDSLAQKETAHGLYEKPEER